MANMTVIAQVKPIKVNEGAPIFPVDLNTYIDNPDQTPLEFTGIMANGSIMPSFIKLSRSGHLSGVPPEGSASSSPYHLKVIAASPTSKLELDINLRVYVPLSAEQIASQRMEAWKELAKEGVLPESMQEIIYRPITKRDIYYLLERYATFTLWNADDMRLATDGRMIQLAGASEKFQVYDFDVCLVATPKDLYTQNRTLGAALDTARAMAREAHRKKWNVEFGGFDRMADAAWYEIYDLNRANANGHYMEVRHYEPAEVTEALAAAQPSNPS